MPDELRSVISSRTLLVSIMLANNEIGSIQPIKELSSIAHQHGALFHTDAVQGVGHIPVDVQDLAIDMLSASAHKFNGPKGVGFLFIKRGTSINPYADGGAQERGVRAGTENVAGIVAMAAALKNNCENMASNAERSRILEKELIDTLRSHDIKFKRNGAELHIPGNVSLSFPDQEGEMLLHRLDLMGICISTGSACDSQNTQISHVLEAIHLEPKYALGTIRVSFGANNSLGDGRMVGEAIAKILSGAIK